MKSALKKSIERIRAKQARRKKRVKATDATIGERTRLANTKPHNC